MRARVQALGGECAWAPGADGGTVFTLWLPLERAGAAGVGAGPTSAA